MTFILLLVYAACALIVFAVLMLVREVVYLRKKIDDLEFKVKTMRGNIWLTCGRIAELEDILYTELVTKKFH